MDLVEVYLDIIYPVFPLFHRQSLIRRTSRGEHLNNRPYYASVMAMAALALARLCDGALIQGPWQIPDLKDPTIPSSEEVFEAAKAAIPADATLTLELGYMQASALLAITAIQYGKIALMRHHLGIYHTFIAVGGLHDESNWPQDLNAVELQERRRLYWSLYTLDVFTAVVWNGTVRSREASSNVAYPDDADDSASVKITGDAEGSSAQPVWLKGWNFVTDLYRILEHAADQLGRMQISSHRTPAIGALLESNALPRAAVLEHMTLMYQGLPDELKTTCEPTGNAEHDLPSFQAANINATMQLVRMVYFTNDQSTLDYKCQVASEVICGFRCIPVAYLKAISVPLLHHLGGIGSILGATFAQGMTESSYHRVRSVLLELAELLVNLEQGLLFTSGTSEKLRSLVAKIDHFMANQRTTTLPSLTMADQNGTITDAEIAEMDLGMGDSPEFSFPSDLFNDWPWALDFT